MNRIITAQCLLILSFCIAVNAQDPKTERIDLAEKVRTFYQKGELEKAIEAGEKLIKIEKSSPASASYTISLINLARIKRDFYVFLQNKIADDKLSASEKSEISDKARQNADDAEELFREALELNEKSGKGQTTQTADLKRDLGWLVYNHSNSGKKTVEASRSRIDEAEKLLLDTIALNEQIRGKECFVRLFSSDLLIQGNCIKQ